MDRRRRHLLATGIALAAAAGAGSAFARLLVKASGFQPR
jgi:hypothetical protein